MLKGDDYPSPEPVGGAMDMTSELANQAAAEAVAAAITQAAASSRSLGEAALDTPVENSDEAEPRPGHGPPPPSFARRAAPFQFGAPHRQAPDSPLTNSQQLSVLREFYARNPNPGKKDLEMLAERTGRPWQKIREYFRQRRNKLRGLVDLEGMEEPGRASGW